MVVRTPLSHRRPSSPVSFLVAPTDESECLVGGASPGVAVVSLTSVVSADTEDFIAEYVAKGDRKVVLFNSQLEPGSVRTCLSPDGSAAPICRL